MAAALNANTIPGLDERQAQALRRAGVDTVEKLAAIDPDATASRTGLDVDDLRRLKAQATAVGQRSATVRPARRRSMTVAWIMLALIVIAVGSVLYAIRARAGAQALVAEQEQQLINATAHIASTAEQYVKDAATSVGEDNWGVAQNDLGRAGDEIAVVEQIAPRSLRGKVQEARSRLGRAQEAVGARDTTAIQRIDELKQALTDLSGKSG